MLSRVKVCFMGGNQAGVLGLLTLLSSEVDVLAVVAYTKELADIAGAYNIPCFFGIHHMDFQKFLKKADILWSVHGREVVSVELLRQLKRGAVNVHPYLYAYKGKSPVSRALAEKNFKGSIGVHWMSEAVDEGDVIMERFVELVPVQSEVEVYNQLYPHYVLTIKESLELL